MARPVWSSDSPDAVSFSESMKNYLRLSFSWYDYQDIEVGAQRLADAIREYAASLEEKKAASQQQGKTGAALLQVAVHGATGRLGSLIVKELENDAETGGHGSEFTHRPIADDGNDLVLS